MSIENDIKNLTLAVEALTKAITSNDDAKAKIEFTPQQEAVKAEIVKTLSEDEDKPKAKGKGKAKAEKPKPKPEPEVEEVEDEDEVPELDADEADEDDAPNLDDDEGEGDEAEDEDEGITIESTQKLFKKKIAAGLDRRLPHNWLKKLGVERISELKGKKLEAFYNKLAE